jgi:hypothetical protein
MSSLRRALRALPLATALACADARAAEEPLRPANEWSLECGRWVGTCGDDPRDGHRYCALTYVHTEAALPGDYVMFGVMRQFGMETTFLQPRSGFAGGSRIWVRVDGLPAREYSAPGPGLPLQQPQPSDPLAAELAKGQYAVLAFQPANGQRRTVQVPLDCFGPLFEQIYAEVP